MLVFFYIMFIIKMLNFGIKENFCEVYNLFLKCFIFIYIERDIRIFFFQVSDVDYGFLLWEYDKVCYCYYRFMFVLQVCDCLLYLLFYEDILLVVEWRGNCLIFIEQRRSNDI